MLEKAIDRVQELNLTNEDIKAIESDMISYYVGIGETTYYSCILSLLCDMQLISKDEWREHMEKNQMDFDGLYYDEDDCICFTELDTKVVLW